jgi:hypothetical protein
MTEREGFDGLDLDGKKSVVVLRTANGIRKLRPSLSELYQVQNLLFPLRTEPNSTFQS